MNKLRLARLCVTAHLSKVAWMLAGDETTDNPAMAPIAAIPPRLELELAAIKSDFERRLRDQLDDTLQELPLSLRRMKLCDFLQLSSVSSVSSVSSRPSAEFLLPATPKTATRRSVRSAAHAAYFDMLYNEQATPLRRQRTQPAQSAHSTPRSFHPQLPQTPANHATTIEEKRPRLTFKTTVIGGRDSVGENSASQSRQQRRSSIQDTTALSSATDGQEVVQIQLKDGNVVDLNLNQSPQSALADANLFGTEAISEVKAKIEAYTSQFLQYLKFFKKLK